MTELEPNPNMRIDPSVRLATEIAEVINRFIGNQEWSGDKPFEVKMVNEETKLSYLYQIRRGDDWITIQESVSNNPSLVRTFSIDKKGGAWTYTDPYFIKYGESSLDKLQEVFEGLKVAIEASAPKKLDDASEQLLSSEN